MGTFVTAVSIGVLDERGWSVRLRPAPLAAGFLASLAVALLANWPILIEPFALLTAAQPDRGSILTLLLTLTTLASDLLLPPFVGLAVSVATREAAPVGRSMVRSVRLLRGLRWRMFGFALVYFVVQAVGQYAVAIPLFYSGVSYTVPGWGRAAVSLPATLIGALAIPIFVSFYLQARRRTDGPSVAELEEAFA